MKNKVITILIIQLYFCFTSSFAQSNIYHIPWAKLDAAYTFPFWLEDNFGNKDTLYVCFDPLWSNIPGDSSMIKLGHIKRASAQGMFIASTEYPDSLLVYKTTGVDKWSNYGAHIWIKFNSSCQIKLSWDVQSLRNSILPFQNTPLLPKAMGGLSFSQTPSTIPGPFYQSDVYFSDTLNQLQYFSYHPIDHININWPYKSDSIYDFNFWLRQWNDFTNANTIKNDDKSTIKITQSGPTTLIVQYDYSTTPFDFTLRNILGQELLKKRMCSDHEIIEVDKFPPGIYIACIQNDLGKTIWRQKIFINNF